MNESDYAPQSVFVSDSRVEFLTREVVLHLAGQGVLPVSIPKRHHFLSEFYLRGFLDPELGRAPKCFWVYQRGASFPVRGFPRRTAQVLDYNTIKFDDGTHDAAVVETLLNIIETPASQLWPKLHNREVTLNEDERMAFAEFLALTAMRVPSTRAAFSEMAGDHIQAVMAWQLDHFDELAAWERLALGVTTRQDMLEIVEASRRARLELTRNAQIEALIRLLPDIANVIRQMRWKFLHAPRGSVFITSDNPVVRIAPNSPTDYRGQDGLGFADVQVSFPISAKLLLLSGWHGAVGHAELSDELVNAFNQRTAGFAHRAVYSPRRLKGLPGFS